MNVNKVSKVKSSYAIACCSSKQDSSPKENEVKNLLACSSNNHSKVISNETKTIKSKFSCKRLQCLFGATKSSSSKSNKASLLNKNEVKTSSCSKILPCSFIGSKSKLPNASEVTPFKKNEISSPVRHPIHAVTDIATVKKVQIPKTAVTKHPPFNLRKKVQISQVFKDALFATRKRGIHKTEGPKVSTVGFVTRGITKPDDPEHFLIGTQKKETCGVETEKTCVPNAVQKNGTTKTSTLSFNEDYPSSSRCHQPYLDIPIYHIKWDGNGEDHEPCGQKCMSCDKDFTCSPHAADYGSHEDDEYKYRIKLNPRNLPAVDILPCGHIFHTECSRYVIPEEESSNPLCVFCLSIG